MTCSASRGWRCRSSHALRFPHACDAGYRALAFALVGLPATEHISFHLGIPFGSFPRACGRKQPKSTRVEEPTFLSNQVGITSEFPVVGSELTSPMRTR